jgi:hypothetical protein
MKRGTHVTLTACNADETRSSPLKPKHVEEVGKVITDNEASSSIHETFDSQVGNFEPDGNPLQPEYDDNDIEQHLSFLRKSFPSMGGLQPTVLGQCVRGLSVPRYDFVPVGQKFVQIMHNYDHWICVTNVFSKEAHDVFVYDSMNTTVTDETVIQTSFLLRLHDARDYIMSHIREYQSQTSRTRLCGLYAVATATAACYGIDLSGHVIDENLLVSNAQ